MGFFCCCCCWCWRWGTATGREREGAPAGGGSAASSSSEASSSPAAAAAAAAVGPRARGVLLAEEEALPLLDEKAPPPPPPPPLRGRRPREGKGSAPSEPEGLSPGCNKERRRKKKREKIGEELTSAGGGPGEASSSRPKSSAESARRGALQCPSQGSPVTKGCRAAARQVSQKQICFLFLFFALGRREALDGVEGEQAGEQRGKAEARRARRAVLRADGRRIAQHQLFQRGKLKIAPIRLTRRQPHFGEKLGVALERKAEPVHVEEAARLGAGEQHVRGQRAQTLANETQLRQLRGASKQRKTKIQLTTKSQQKARNNKRIKTTSARMHPTDHMSMSMP
jgi:hypothetical protein